MPEKQQPPLGSTKEEEDGRRTAAAGGAAGSGQRQSVGTSGESIKKQQDVEDGEEGEEEQEEAFDEPDDELEEFDVIAGEQNAVDLEIAQWDEDWDAAGWDDEDVNDDFIKRLQQELEAFKQAHLAKQQQQQQMRIG